MMTGGEASVCTRIESDVRVKEGGPVEGWVHRLVERRREEPEAIYRYKDENGVELFQVVRFPGKKIRQRRHDPGSPDSKADGFVWNLGDVRRVLYRLPELIAFTGHVWVVEGEKDVDTLAARGQTVTCNPHGAGAGKWERTQDLARKHLAGRDVTVIADNDEEGIPHGRRSAAGLVGYAKSVRLVTCRKGKDITDHLNAGGTLDELDDLSFGEPETSITISLNPNVPDRDRVYHDCNYDVNPEPEEEKIDHRAPDAELRIVSASLFSRECFARALEIVRLDDFTDPKLIAIWASCIEAKRRGCNAEPTVVAECLRGHGELARIGGLSVLESMANAVAPYEPTPDEIADCAAILRARNHERSVVRIAKVGAEELSRANGTSIALAVRLHADLGDVLEEAKIRRDNYGIIGVDEIFADLEPATYFVPSLRLADGAGAPHMLAGYGFSGKTVALQSLIISLCSARPVWGVHAVTRPYRILHVDYEQGLHLTRERYHRLRRALGVPLEELRGRLMLTSHPGLDLHRENFDEWLRVLEGFDGVWIDSFKAGVGDVDENSSDARKALDMLGRLAHKTGCRPGIIHHARKPSKDAPGGKYTIRGSGALYDALDSCFIFNGTKSEPVEVMNEKSRTHGVLLDPLALEIEDVPNDDDPRWGLRVSLRGIERVHESRARTAEAAEAVRLKIQIAHVRKALRERPLSTERELRAITKLGPMMLAECLIHMSGEVASDGGKFSLK